MFYKTDELKLSTRQPSEVWADCRLLREQLRQAREVRDYLEETLAPLVERRKANRHVTFLKAHLAQLRVELRAAHIKANLAEIARIVTITA